MLFQNFVLHSLLLSSLVELEMVSSTASAMNHQNRNEDCAFVIECEKKDMICVINVDDKADLRVDRHSEVMEDQAVQIESLVRQGFAARQVLIGADASRYIRGIEYVTPPFTLVMSESRGIGFLHQGFMADDLTLFAEYLRDGGQRPGGEPFFRLVNVRLRTELCGKRL